MNHSDLAQLIDNFKNRFSDTDTTETMLMHQQMNMSQTQLNDAKNLLLSGIDNYQNYDDYNGAINLINESIKILPSAACFFNRGTIHWCEKNYLEAFKDHCSSLILDKDNYPLSYFYLANSLYELAGQSNRSVKDDEVKILDLVVEMLEEGAGRGDNNADQMLPHVKKHRDTVKC